jgi:Flp pilus assembly protein TadB
MNTVLMAALCAGVALGLLLIIQGLRGNRILPPVTSVFPDGTTTATATAWTLTAAVAGSITLAYTRWPGAAAGVAALVAGFPWFFGGGGASKREIERTQAIATWTEMIRDNLAGAAGLEQALLATTDSAPAPIAQEVKAFGNRLEGRPLADALSLLGRDLQHPAADLVVVTLANAARVEGRDLGSLLTRLSESIRADVRMRLRIEVGRARIRTSSKIVLGVTLATVALVYFLSRDLLAIYDTGEGQLWLLATFGLFLAALWLMNYFAQIQVPERFTARRNPTRSSFGEPPTQALTGSGSNVGGAVR